MSLTRITETVKLMPYCATVLRPLRREVAFNALVFVQAAEGSKGSFHGGRIVDAW